MQLNPKGKYIFIKDSNGKRVLEHRAILHMVDPRENEQELHVHHIDGDKSNNNPSNLKWMTPSEHMKLHKTGKNHFRCDGEYNANYRHGMCVDGYSKEYKSLHNHKTYMRHRKERLDKQNAYAITHREHKRWYDKLRHWKKQLLLAETEDRILECKSHIQALEENAI